MQPLLPGLSGKRHPRQGDARREMSRDALTIIEIHEASGGTVSVQRIGSKVLWSIDGEPDLKMREASEILAQRRKKTGSLL